MAPYPRGISSNEFCQALEQAGVIRRGDLIQRLVIDVRAGHMVQVYEERVGDERLLNVALALEGIEVTMWREALDVQAGPAAEAPADPAGLVRVDVEPEPPGGVPDRS